VYQSVMLTCAGTDDPTPSKMREIGARRDQQAARDAAARAQLMAAVAEEDGVPVDDVDALTDESGNDLDESTPYASVTRASTPGYFAYRPLWRSLLRLDHLTPDDRSALAPGVTRTVVRTVYDAFIAAVLRVLDRLDVAYTLVDNDADDATPVTRAANAQAKRAAADADAVAAMGATVQSGDTTTASLGASERVEAAAANARESTKTTATTAAGTTTKTTPATTTTPGSVGGVNDELSAARAQDAAATNPQRLRAEQESDMRLFLNLVRLCEKLLPCTQRALFARRWVYTFGGRLIELSNRFPLLSGFYRMLTVVMQICSGVGYFDMRVRHVVLAPPAIAPPPPPLDAAATAAAAAGAYDDDDNDDDGSGGGATNMDDDEGGEQRHDAADLMAVDGGAPDTDTESEPDAQREDEPDNDGARDDAAAFEIDSEGDEAAAAAAANDVVASDDRASLALFGKFVREVTHRLRQYKNELLAACVRLVLSVPRALVDVPLLVPALDIALRVGVAYAPLARAAFDALERWLDVRAHALAPHLARLLPRLHAYLLADADEAADIVNISTDEYQVSVSVLCTRAPKVRARLDVPPNERRNATNVSSHDSTRQIRSMYYKCA
jgi:hypothetical protein